VTAARAARTPSRRPCSCSAERGPYLYAADASFHGAAYSPLHKGPLLCAACHEHRNALGVAVLSTYSEWQQGPYAARGTSCQECHMPLVPGTVTGEGVSGQ
jgi:formate-dependent nitrite reductase cytochrome c552 subunit